MIPHLGTAARSRRAVVREREDQVVAGLATLAPHLDGEPDPEFRELTRARLVAMAAVRPAPAPASPRKMARSPRMAAPAPARWRSRLTAGLAGAALAVTAVAAVVAVAADAGPGSLLYGVKRGTEATQLALAGDARRGETLLSFAATRLDELNGLLANGDADPTLVGQTLEAMDEQTLDGAAWQGRLAVREADAVPLDGLAAWQHGQHAALAALQPGIPVGARQEYTESLSVLDAVAQRVDGLETALQCAAGPATEGTDQLGPKPGTCPPSTSSGPSGAGSGASAGPSGTPATPPAGAGGGGATGNPGGSAASGGGSGAGGGGLPGTGVPNVPAPRLPLPSVAVPTPGLPSVPLPRVSLPSVSLPSVSLPGASQPAQQEPAAPAPSTGGVLPSLPTLCVPTLSLPTC